MAYLPIETSRVFVITATFEAASAIVGSEVLGVTDSPLRVFKFIEKFDGKKFMAEEFAVFPMNITETSVTKELVTDDPKRRYMETHYYTVEDDSSAANGEGGTIIFSIDEIEFDKIAL